MRSIDAERSKRRRDISNKRENGRKNSTEKSSKSPSASRSRTSNWTHDLDSSLLSIMKQEYLEGNFTNGQFSKQSWSTIVETFNSKTNLSFNREHLRNRLKVLRNVFRVYNELVSLSGWNWDLESNLPKPDDPAMWDHVISLNPQYAKCREKPCPEYPILKLFFTRNITNQTQIDAMAVELIDKEENSSSFPKLPQKSSSNFHYYQNTPLQNNNEYEEEEEEEELNEDLSSDNLSEKSENVTKALEELSQINKRQQEIINYLMEKDVLIGKVNSTEQCIGKLKTVRNLPAEAFLRVCEVFRDKHERSVFMSLEGKTLHAWIQCKVRTSQQNNNNNNNNNNINLFRVVNSSNDVEFN
ncbi:hypothetical protein LUZ60_010810 [Juncus effusus]|nr:hypothetical protein LUZ60_010810 [Juncus effusus]